MKPILSEVMRCTGCGACAGICINNCIGFKPGKYGELYPTIDFSNCLECGQCTKVCPILNNNETNMPLKTYAAWAQNSKIRERASSGGVAYIFYKNFLAGNKKAAVYGPIFIKDLSLEYCRFEFNDDIRALQGSKYVYSQIKCFDKIEDDIKNHFNILFIGMPCQVAAVKSYLKLKKIDRIYTVELICHGMPPDKYLHEHIKFLTHDNITNVSFRKNHKYVLNLFSGKQVVYEKPDFLDSYLMAYSKRMICREACYHCKFATAKRVADITIGDFWGIDWNMQEKTENGISSIMLNNKKGKELFDLCKNDIYFFERSYAEAVKGNSTLVKPLRVTKKRKIFKNLYAHFPDFEFAVLAVLWPKLLRNNIVQIIPGELKNVIKNLLWKKD